QRAPVTVFDGVRHGIEPQAGCVKRAIAAAAAQQCLQTRDELGEGKRLGDVVVAAGIEAGDAVGQRVPRRQEQHRRLHSTRAQRLAHVPAVRFGQPDVDDERVRVELCRLCEQLSAGRDGLGTKAFLTQPAAEDVAQLRIVLGDQDQGLGHCSRSIAPRGKCRMPRAARATAMAALPTAAPTSRSRKLHGTARWSGGGSKTCRNIATSVSASSQPSSAARAIPAARTSAASLQRKAAAWRSDAPSETIVASSFRRSARATPTNSVIAAAASATANTSSMREMPVKSTVVIELTVCAV